MTSPLPDHADSPGAREVAHPGGVDGTEQRWVHDEASERIDEAHVRRGHAADGTNVDRPVEAVAGRVLHERVARNRVNGGVADLACGLTRKDVENAERSLRSAGRDERIVPSRRHESITEDRRRVAVLARAPTRRLVRSHGAARTETEPPRSTWRVAPRRWFAGRTTLARSARPEDRRTIHRAGERRRGGCARGDRGGSIRRGWLSSLSLPFALYQVNALPVAGSGCSSSHISVQPSRRSRQPRRSLSPGEANSPGRGASRLNCAMYARPWP